MTIQVKNRNLVFIALFAITAIFFLGGYVGYKKAEKAAEVVETALNKEIISYQYKVGDLTRYSQDLERLVRSQNLLIDKGEEARKELRSINKRQSAEIRRLTEEIDSLFTNWTTDEADSLDVNELLYMIPELEDAPDQPL